MAELIVFPPHRMPSAPHATRKPKYARVRPTAQLTTTQQDVPLLQFLTMSRFSETSSLLLALASSRHPGGLVRRLRGLYDHGLLDRVWRPQLHVFSTGGSSPVWFLGGGLLERIAANRHELERRSPSERDAYIDAVLRPACSEERQTKAAILEELGILPLQQGLKLLDANDRVALRVGLGLSSNLGHFLMGADVLALLTLALARQEKLSLADFRGDGDFRYRVPHDTLRLAHVAAFASTNEQGEYFPIEPDGLALLRDGDNLDALAIEVETGTNSRAKLEAKVAYWLALHATGTLNDALRANDLDDARSLRVLFVCRDAHHQQAAINAVLSVGGWRAQRLFLFAHLGDGGLQVPSQLSAEGLKQLWTVRQHEEFRAKLRTKDGGRVRAVDDATERLPDLLGRQLSQPRFACLRTTPVIPKGATMEQKAQAVRAAITYEPLLKTDYRPICTD